jgi:hypothetical protein
LNPVGGVNGIGDNPVNCRPIYGQGAIAKQRCFASGLYVLRANEESDFELFIAKKAVQSHFRHHKALGNSCYPGLY